MSIKETVESYRAAKAAADAAKKAADALKAEILAYALGLDAIEIEGKLYQREDGDGYGLSVCTSETVTVDTKKLAMMFPEVYASCAKCGTRTALTVY